MLAVLVGISTEPLDLHREFGLPVFQVLMVLTAEGFQILQRVNLY